MIRRRRTAVLCAAAVLTAGCTPFGADTLRAVESGPAEPPARTVAVDRTAWWGSSSYRLTEVTTTRQPDGRTAVELVLGVVVESPVPVAAAPPRATLESDGVAVSGALEMTPPPYGRASLTATVQDVGTPGQPLDPDRLALVLTAPGAARAVLPIGTRSGQDPTDLRPVPLRASTQTVHTGRYRLTLAAARLRADCTGDTGPAATVVLGTVPVVPRPLRALKPGQHTAQILFEAPPGTTGDSLLLHLTLPDGRRIAPSLPIGATPYPDPSGRVNLAAWFDFYGDTAGTYTLEAADREDPEDPEVLTLVAG
ncbi:hypothetical protein HUT16_08690 [Kitasatospora sp. NA04385]|uniref:hypothetical protein n=1 Tax=Kitasatospora sp. NA04385 TaxID=2742135 RepID=UPI0015909FFF|nr:hypothetical protein [Kitasatospora sp. NA04385]QKW19128.1 hypothetical protein HUT16_08690 [Kitasatospora sp. NA04385]